MDCDRFLEERLSGPESAEFRAHRAGCPACGPEGEEYAEIRRLYREASTERWRGSARRPVRSRWLAGIPVAAAALLMVGVLVLLLGSPPSPPAASEPAPVFSRIHLEPWDRGEARIARAVDDVWRRLEELEGNPR
jgi:hypothetical protein